MLVLSRQKDESIIIGSGDDAVEVTIVDVRGDKVRLGIIAPKSTSVHRKEIYEAIMREKEQRAAELEAAILKDTTEDAQNIVDGLKKQAEGKTSCEGQQSIDLSSC